MTKRVAYKETFVRKRADKLMDWKWTVTARNNLHTSRGVVKIVRLSAYGNNVTLHMTEDYLRKHFKPGRSQP